GYMRRVVQLVRQAAQAAEALHRHGVVHRDIKPGNIVVDETGENATLLGLELAQVADDVEGELTQPGMVIGTLRYASPEQLLAVAPVDGRSDVYGLGATLWELLTLRPLFKADEVLPWAYFRRRIQSEDPERPRKFNSRVPHDLEAVVLRC